MTESSTDAITYPPIEPPPVGDGSAVQVAPGVFWMRMPLFVSLPWINVWAISDAGGWTIVDTGMRSPKTMEAWQCAFAGLLKGLKVTRVIATHMHPDHCGMAGWITERSGTELWMTQTEYLSCRVMASDTGRRAPPEAIDFYHRAGWDDIAIESYREKFGSFGAMIYPLPNSYRRIIDGEIIKIGMHEWTVVVGHGHSPEHATLYCPELALLISGDQVLPGISSNVSVLPTEPLADPLGAWLKSLEKLKMEIPDNVLVLPAHKIPFKGLHARLTQLINGHRDGLRKLALGFQLINVPRIGWMRLNDELYKPLETDEASLGARLDRTHHAATVFEAAGCGAAWATKLGEQAIANDPQVAARTNCNPFFALPYCGDQAAISEAIAEWADGDALAAHYGHGHDVFCTLDRGRGAGTQSVLHSSRRAWLESDFGIAILTSVELAERFRL